MEPSLFWKKLLLDVDEAKATDIHFSGGAVKIRVNMGLIPYCELKNDYQKCLEFLAEENHLKVLKEKGECDFAGSHEGFRLRCNIYKTVKGICGAFRPLPSKSFSWDKMLLSKEIMEVCTTSGQGLILVSGPTGSGKCLGPNTLVLKYDGTLIFAKDVKAGDLLMGPDSKPRKVLGTTTGKGPLYQITPKKGEPWICNDVHVMTLSNPEKNTKFPKIGGLNTLDIEIKKFLKLPKETQKQLELIQFHPESKSTQTIPWAATALKEGDYAGFQVDGDGRFLLGDFTVTHNSTTLCSILDYINAKFSYNIITIEDPIEYIFEDKKSTVNQREIGPHTGNFHIALRAALRQNPNVIFVGEIRDYETALTALHAAETGHLVFSTLHTKRVANTVSRIMEMAPPGSQSEIRSVIANNLLCVICQRLLPRKDKTGIIPCREILVMTPAASNYIKEGKEKNLPSVMNANRDRGMIDWDSALNKLHMEGFISKDTYEANQDKGDKI